MSGSWAHYKLACGYTIWDRGCGVLPDLEDTMSWCWAVSHCTFAEKLQMIVDA